MDQEQPAIDLSVGGSAIGGSYEQKLAQTVTAGISGYLTEVRLLIACNQSDLIVEIQETVNGVPNGVVLTSAFFPRTNLPSFFPIPGVVALRSFPLPIPVYFSAGSQFAIVLSATASQDGCGVFMGPIGDAYLGGDLFFDSRPNQPGRWVCVCQFAGARFDLPFQTIVAPPVVEVQMDIKPGSAGNPVEIASPGVLPVAILTTGAFDATTVDPVSVRFGPNGAHEVHGKGHFEDVNLDGWMDLLLHFSIQATGLRAGDTSASLEGRTFSGQAVQGTDAIVTVGRAKFGR